MTLIVENGSGVAGANAYNDSAFVLAYLTERNRETEGSWSTVGDTATDAAIVEATDFVEARFRDRFLGQKEMLDISTARSTLAFTVQPLTTETVTIGDVTYRFIAAIAVAGDVLIGDNLADSIDNLAAAVNSSPLEGATAFHPDTVANTKAAGTAFIDDTFVATSELAGTRGNVTVTTETVTGATWNFATLIGGSNIVVPQPLSFPRRDLFDRDGIPIIGVPERLKFAISEYAVRAVLTTTTLAPDPAVDARGGVLIGKRSKIGPIETDLQYLAGTATGASLPVYPAADRLLNDFISSEAGSFR